MFFRSSYSDIEMIRQLWKAGEVNLRSAGNRLEDSLLLACCTDNHGSQPSDEKVQKEVPQSQKREYQSWEFQAKVHTSR